MINYAVWLVGIVLVVASGVALILVRAEVLSETYEFLGGLALVVGILMCLVSGMISRAQRSIARNQPRGFYYWH